MCRHDGAANPIAHLMLAHGAGAGMDHAFMNSIAALIAERGVSVTRFEFSYMAARRDSGKRRPAPRGDKLVEEYEAAVVAVRQGEASTVQDGLPILIGGKSLGARVASLAAAKLHDAGMVQGLACLSYPFHPAGKPEKLRTAHLETFNVPALIVQGTRDPLGSRDEVAEYHIDPRIAIEWLEDGDHDLKPRKKSGHSHAAHLEAAADAVARFADGL